MSVALLVNTCDKFSDLWPIFFDLYERFWNAKYKIYLSTETKDYNDERFDIEVVHPKGKMPWSNRLANCVMNIKEDYVILMPEECMLEDKVNVEMIEKAIDLLKKDKDIACIHLVHIVGAKEEDLTYYPFMRKVYDFKNYIIAQQICIWDRKKWLRYIYPNENPWEYEVLGSTRGPFDNDKFYAVNDFEREAFTYDYGFLVYRGYWCKEEKDRLEYKLGVKFDNKARKVLKLNDIVKVTKLGLLFYNKIRLKRIWIIILKKIFKKQLKGYNWNR